MRKLFCKICVLILVLLAGATAFAKSTVTINFPTAATTGALYPLGAAITNLWTTKIDYVKASSQASGGGVENLNLLAMGEAQVSIAISSNCYESYTGTGTFDGRKNEKFRVIGGLYYNPNQVIVTKASGIDSLAKMKGAHFATGAVGSSTEGESKNHFTAAGLKYPDDIKVENIGFTEAVDMIRNKQLDGAWIMAALGNAAVTEATSTAGAVILNIDDAVIANLQKDYPWYAKLTIPAGTYAGQDKDIQTTAIKMVMFTTADLSEQTVYDLTKVFWENVEKLAESNKGLTGVKAADAVSDIANLPLHPGAEKYYKEIGVLK
ncbi:MAG: TAXI family TRAP transporter solute-binding subunit [Fusobacteriaceae bacterium]|jgi:TRAP transporter TAXI family solute receptor|nr:TAXI family TRAP transporter solute-binding subunit [Fusobacteriaceae bacterium]